LHTFLGEGNAPLRLAMLLPILSQDERDAWATILAESIKSRTRDAKDLDAVLDAIGELADIMGNPIAATLGTMMDLTDRSKKPPKPQGKSTETPSDR